MTYAEWGRETGIDETLIRYRIAKAHWSVEEALTIPLNPNKGRRKQAV